MELVDGVLEVETTEQGIRRELSRPQNVTPAIGLDFAEREQLAHATVEVTPHPPVNRAQDPIERCDSRKWRHIDLEEEQISISL